MNSPESMQKVIALANERELTHANIGMFEVNGSFRSKRYNVRHLEKAMTDGIAWIAVPSALDPAENIIETNPFANPESGFGDGVLRIDADTCREYPLDSDGSGMLLIGRFVDETALHCPRALLAQEIERLDALGFDAFGGFELEGAMLAETESSIQSKRPEDVNLMPGFDRVYSLVDQAHLAPLMDELLGVCTTMGIELDTIHPEYLGMLEVGIRPATGMRIADNAGLYKAVAKAITRKHGGMMSFMARRHPESQGCGAHINLSLKDKATGEGVFHDPDAEHRMSPIMRHVVAGLLAYVPELFLMLAPHLNSYKRFRPGLFTPLTNTWAINNKTVAFRVINITPAATRVEFRVAGADVSPHIALTAVLMAARLGIEGKLELAPPVEGNGWAVEDAADAKFPLTFAEAIDRFERSEIAREFLGNGFVDAFVGDRRWEIDQLANTVTDWELRTFGNL
jgi:glutamine synthetase